MIVCKTTFIKKCYTTKTIYLKKIFDYAFALSVGLETSTQRAPPGPPQTLLDLQEVKNKTTDKINITFFIIIFLRSFAYFSTVPNNHVGWKVAEFCADPLTCLVLSANHKINLVVPH